MSLEKQYYYHVQVKYYDSNYDMFAVVREFDLSEENATTFGTQYNEGALLCSGKWIQSSSIREIEIRKTVGKAKTVAFRKSSIFGGQKFELATRDFIKSRPGTATKTQYPSSPTTRSAQALSKDIFIVHGNDHTPMKDLKAMLYEFGLNPIVLHEQPSGSKTLVEKLEKYSDVGYAFVILTPDDLGCSVENVPTTAKMFRDILKQRARQNVVLEFGYFINKLGRSRVCCLHKGDVELPSDMKGIGYIPFSNSVEEARIRIMKELKQAGYGVRI